MSETGFGGFVGVRGLSVKCLGGLVVDVNDVKTEKRKVAKTTVAEGHPRRRPAVGGDSASYLRLCRYEGVCMSVCVCVGKRVTMLIRV